MENKTKIEKQINQYILDCIDSEPYEVVTTTNKEKLTFLYSTFKSEYGHMIPRIGAVQAFSEWTRGLPSIFNIAFTNYDILQLAKKWGIIPVASTEEQEDIVINNY
jgi:hypothetical protein